MGFRGGNGPFGAHLPPRLRLGGKYGPLRPISHPQTMENREFTARIHCFTTITRTKYHCLDASVFARNDIIFGMTSCRGAAGAGATGASAPVDIRQRVRRTRPQND